jgi:hypothetical protein
MTHELKILPEFYNDILSGKKNFEIRKADRDFQEGDKIILKECDGVFTGRELERWIGYIHRGNGEYGLSEGYCILGLKRSAPLKAIDGDF